MFNLQSFLASVLLGKKKHFPVTSVSRDRSDFRRTDSRVETLSATDTLGGKDESLNLGALQLCLQVNHTDLSGRDRTVN